jgi:hypothetical protein
MWSRLANFVLQFRLPLLLLLLVITAVMGFYARQVSLSYEFSKAIPVDNPKYKDYLAFRQKFGDDGNVIVIGVQPKNFFDWGYFNAYRQMQDSIRKVKHVTNILSVASAVNLVKDTISEKLLPVNIFDSSLASQQELDGARTVFFNLPFYKGRLYNAETGTYLMAIGLNKDSINSPLRTQIVANILSCVQRFEQATGTETYKSGLPLIRTISSDRIQKEMRFFLIGSLVLSGLILLMFFRSVSTMLISLVVVGMGVVWSVGLLQCFSYKITILTALIPPLIVVIGIPNCIYFINKYHTAYLNHGIKNNALVEMVSKMGVVTLFCNITAAIGFGVFALTKSAILKEFGVVAGISIMLIFVISFILLPAVLSYLPAPGKRQTQYLSNRFITNFLLKVELWVLQHKKTVYGITGALLILAIAGIFRLQTVGFIVDDLPKKDKLYTDLKFFERNFKGVMPLEIVIDTKRRNGLAGMRALTVFSKVDSLAQFIAAHPSMNQPLSLAEGLKFAKQAFYEGDSANYQMPNMFDGSFVGEYLRPNRNDSNAGKNNFSKMLATYMDSSRQTTRLSVSMADLGTRHLPPLLDTIQQQIDKTFDTANYKVQLTGTSITFLEGSRFIINGLKESIFWAFLLISLCMLYLFRSFRILLCSLIPNLIPLVITAGIMGWAGVPLKPSTVLVFSVALGIAIDITIRFLVNYKQELGSYNYNIQATVTNTIRSTGLSIVYTSLVLIAGFVIFCFSSFGGTIALGWLTSVTLLVATLTNLILLPVLLLAMGQGKKAK